MFDYFRKFDHRLWILALGWIASAVGFSLVFPFLAIYFHSELGVSLTHIGLFIAAAAIVRAIFQAVGGELSDKFGRYRIMVFAQSVRTIIFMVIAFAVKSDWGFYGIGALVIINSIFGAMFQPAANATVADVVEPKYRTEGYAIVRVAGNFGWAIGPALGGFIAAKSYAVLFVISGCMTLVSSVIIAFFLRGIGQFARPSESLRFRDIFALKANQLIFKHAALIFILYLIVSQLITPFSLYSVDFKGITKGQLGMLFALNGLMVTLLQIPTTRLLSGIRLTIQLALGAAIYAVGYLWVGLTGTFILFIIAMIIITTAENFISPPALSLTANLAPRGRVGRYMGIYGFSVAAGWSMGPFLGTLFLDIAKPDFFYAWGVIAVLAIFSALGFWGMTRLVPPKLNLYKEI